MVLNLPDLNAPNIPNQAIQSGQQYINPAIQQPNSPIINVGHTDMQPDDEPLTVGSGNENLPSSPDTLDSRASRVKYGLGDLLNKTRDEIYQNLQDGREDELRNTAASTIDERKRQATENLITQATANKQGPLTPEERDGLIEIVANMNNVTDPNTVFETAYGKQFITTLDTVAQGNPDNILTDVNKVDPEAVAAVMNAHTSLAAKTQVINTNLENAKDRAKSQGWGSYGLDFAKGLIPGWEDIRLRGLGPDVGVFQGGGLGENLEETRRALLRLPPDELDAKLKEISNNLNPGLAVDFLTAMKGMSTDDITVKNLSLPTSLIGTGVGAKVGKASLRFLPSLAAKLDEQALQSAAWKMRDVTKAAEDMTRAAADPNASKSTAEAAAGDLSESAVTRATTNAVSDAQNVPQAQKRAVEANVSTLRADREQFKANPGQLGQDIVNRIDEQAETLENQLINTAENIQKNERLPQVLSNESSVRLIIEDMKNKYRDLRNSIIDTSKIYKENISNTYLVDFLIGQTDGSYFKQRSVAENYIKYHGLADANIEEGTNQAFTSKNVAINKATQNITDAQKIIDRERDKLNNPQITDKARAKSQEQISTAEEYIVDQAIARRAAGQVADVEQQGLGYYIRVTKPIDETRPVIRQAIAQTTNTKIPSSPVTNFLNSWVGKFRTPEEVLSLAERQNRLTTTYAPASYFQILVDNSKDIKQLRAGPFSKGRQRWKEWQQGLENAQELPDPTDPDRKGHFFSDPSEMETYWQQWFHRLPDEQEVAAYFEFKRGMEFDRVFRNIAEHRNQQRVGTETHNIVSTDATGKEVKSADFNGVVRSKLPGSADNAVIYGSKLGEERIVALDKMSVAAKKELDKDIDRGFYKLIELYNPERRDLNGFGSVTDQRIRYVLAPQVETRALDWNHVVRRGGGHIDYDYDFYIKQAKVRYDNIGNRHWYEGDTTIMASPTQGIGAGVAKHLEQIRQLFKAKQEDAAREYSNKNMHVDWDKVQSWFKGYKDETGKYQPPRLNLNEEIRVVPKGRQILDIDNNLSKKYADFRNGTREGSLARQSQVEFNQERDAFELLGVNVEGTRANPLYKVAPADKIDAITTMNRGMQRIVRSNFMDDYKTMAVEHWLAQAADHLDVRDLKELYSAPYYYFNEGKFKNGTPPEIQSILEASRYHTQQLTGQPSMTDALLHSAAQKLADASFNTFGPKGLVLTPTALLPYLRDPFATARSFAFNMKLGLFNIPQFIVQAGNYANILGIAGYKYAAPGTLGAQLHFWSTVNRNPQFLEHLDSLASKMTLPGSSAWRPGEFKEAFEEMGKTGFGTVGGEYGALDNMKTNIIKNGAETFLDWGRFPFKQGETNARYGAWYTAFKEFRDANPVGRITNEDRAAILQRADLLNVNMSRASSSAIHKGIWSVPTQFYTYQIRLTELMFGSRLTAQERARLFLTNAALFGVPMAAGTTSLPIADWLRTKALEDNYVVGDDYFNSMLMEGVPSAIGAIISGGGDPSKGTYYDVGPRFGTKGLEFLGNATGTDKGWLDILGGPIYSIIKDTVAQSDGLARAMLSMARGDEEVFPMTVEDVADVAKEISSFNAGWRVYAATQFGRWVSKKDAYLADTSPAQALFGAAFGLKDVRIDDITLKANSLKSQKDYEQKIEQQFRQEFSRGVLAQQDNPELARKFFTRAQAWLTIGGYRQDRINSVISKALSDNQSIMSKTDWDFYIRKAPDQNKEGGLKAYQKTIQLQDKKN